jgi:hypothetical protein
MIGFVEKTWVAWWVLASLEILRWFHVLRLNDTLELELNRKETEKYSAVAA